MTTLYLNDVLLPLSHLLGEESIPNPVPASRTDAVQGGLNRMGRLYDFDWTRQRFVVPLTGGIGTLDPTIRVDPKMDVRIEVTGAENDYVLDPADVAGVLDLPQGSYKYALRTNADGTTSILTSETDQASLTVTATLNYPVISATQGVIFPDPWIIARFALIIIREGEDKDADTSVEEAKAQAALQELIAAEMRNNGPKRAVTIQEKMGTYTGQPTSDTLYANWNE